MYHCFIEYQKGTPNYPLLPPDLNYRLVEAISMVQKIIDVFYFIVHVHINPIMLIVPWKGHLYNCIGQDQTLQNAASDQVYTVCIKFRNFY